MMDQETVVRHLAYALNMECCWYTTNVCLRVGQSIVVLCYVESRTYEIGAEEAGVLIPNRVVQAVRMLEGLDRLNWHRKE